MDIGNNERLLSYQREYLEDGNLESWARLWLLSYDICKNMIRGEQKRKGFRLSYDDFMDKSMEAVIYVLRRYHTRKGYRIKSNYISALKFGVRHALYHQTMEQKIYNRHLDINNPALKISYNPEFI